MWSYKSIGWKKRLKDCERLITAPFMSRMLTNGTNHGRLITVIDADVTSHRWSARIFFLPRLLKGPCTMVDVRKKRRRRKEKKGGRVEWSRTYSFGKRSGGRNELARSLLTNTLFTNSKSTWVLALVCSSMTKIITQNPVPMPRVMKFRTDYLKFSSSDISLFGIDSGTTEKISNLIYLVFMTSISLQQAIILIRPVSSIFKNVNFQEPLLWNLHFLDCVTKINAKLRYVFCLLVYEIKVLEISTPLHHILEDFCGGIIRVS